MTQSNTIALSDLMKAIDAWGKRGATWAKEGHKLALQALVHLNNTGDIGPCNRLYVAMPKGSKSSAMAAWLMSFAALQPNPDATDKAKPFVYTKDKKCDPEGGAKTPWFEFRPEPTPLEMFDVVPALEAVLAKAKKAATVGHAELIEGITALLAGARVDEPEEQDEEQTTE